MMHGHMNLNLKIFLFCYVLEVISKEISFFQILHLKLLFYHYYFIGSGINNL